MDKIFLLLDGLILSLKILAVYCIFQQGNLLGSVRIFIRNLLANVIIEPVMRPIEPGKKHPDINKRMALVEYLCKPLFECLACMTSVWGLIFTGFFSSWILHWEVILISCGINVIIQSLIPFIDGSKPTD